MDKYLISYIIALGVVVVGTGVFVISNSSLQPANITEVLNTPEPLCENQDEIETFEEAISVVWTAKMDGCLVSCEGASFTRVPENDKYPRFVGYSAELLQDDIWQDGDIVKIFGDWVGIGSDHPVTVFNNKCVPIVNINKIELLN
ncbi:MAG: hypothetical protein WD989_00485 [Candidatus Paceibacterota bacterium]